MEKLSVKDALKHTLSELGSNATSDKIIWQMRELADPKHYNELRLVEYALSDDVFSLVKTLSQNNGIKENDEAILSINKILQENHKLSVMAAYEVIAILAFALDIGFDIVMEKETIWRENAESESKIIQTIKYIDTITTDSDIKDKEQCKKEGKERHAIRKEIERNFHTGFLKWIFLLSYGAVMLAWTTSFVMIGITVLSGRPWEITAASGAVATMLTLAACKIIPLIKPSYERAMYWPEVTYFLKITDKESNECRREVVKTVSPTMQPFTVE